MNEEEFEELFGNTPFENIKKIQHYIGDLICFYDGSKKKFHGKVTKRERKGIS